MSRRATAYGQCRRRARCVKPTASGGIAPTADAGADDSHNRFYGAAYALAGSATGDAVITYEWTKVSGTPVPTFADDTDPETDVTFDAAGAVVLRLTATNAHGSDSDDVEITVTEVGALDALATTPNGLWCFGVRLRSAYTGALFRVRRASDNAEADIGYDAATDLADTAALAAHCSGTNGFIAQVYDQSGNARTLTQATTAQQQKVYDSATGPVLANGNVCTTAAGSDDNQARADACGISGTGGKSVAWCGRPGAAAVGLATQFGGATTTNPGEGVQVLFQASATQITVGIYTASRTFTATDYTAAMQRLVGRLQASGTAGQFRLAQNGSALSELSSVNPSQASSLVNATTFFGRATSAVNGTVCAEAVWGADISDADAGLWDTTMQTFYG